MKKRESMLKLEVTKAGILDHTYQNFKVNTMLVSFGKRRLVLSTWDGYKEVSFEVNTYTSPPMSKYMMKNYQKFKENLPPTLGVPPRDLLFDYGSRYG